QMSASPVTKGSVSGGSSNETSPLLLGASGATARSPWKPLPLQVGQSTRSLPATWEPESTCPQPPHVPHWRTFGASRYSGAEGVLSTSSRRAWSSLTGVTHSG